MGITGKDPELHLENAREARMTVENHIADERSTLAGIDKRHRNQRGPYSDTPQHLGHTRTSFPFPKPAPTIASPAQGNHLPPWAPQQQGQEPLGSSSSCYSRHMAPHTALLLYATLLDPAAPPPPRDLRHCSIAPDPLAVRYGAGFSVLLNFLISEISIIMV